MNLSHSSDTTTFLTSTTLTIEMLFNHICFQRFTTFQWKVKYLSEWWLLNSIRYRYSQLSVIIKYINTILLHINIEYYINTLFIFFRTLIDLTIKYTLSINSTVPTYLYCFKYFHTYQLLLKLIWSLRPLAL